MDRDNRQADEAFMRRALALAAQGEGWVHPNPMVGAVIVRNGAVIGEGYHHRCGQPHAEREALAHLTEPAAGATLYVTLEPCCHYGRTPPCTEAILQHQIARVVVGSRDPNPKVAGKGVETLRRAGVQVDEDVLRTACDALNRVFFHYITTGTPYVILKYAMTLDGKIATRTGASRWITGETAREEVQRLRHRCMGIMVGIGTVLRDDPRLNCRLPGGRDPVRIVCDSALRLPETSQIARTAGEQRTLDICAFPHAPAGPVTETAFPDGSPLREHAAALRRAGVALWNAPDPQGRVDLPGLMAMLGQAEIDSILLEGGGTLNESALRCGIVGEIQAFAAPKVFGGSGQSPVAGLGVAEPSEAAGFVFDEIRRLGDDVLLICRPKEEN